MRYLILDDTKIVALSKTTHAKATTETYSVDDLAKSGLNVTDEDFQVLTEECYLEDGTIIFKQDLSELKASVLQNIHFLHNQELEKTFACLEISPKLQYSCSIPNLLKLLLAKDTLVVCGVTLNSEQIQQLKNICLQRWLNCESYASALTKEVEDAQDSTTLQTILWEFV